MDTISQMHRTMAHIGSEIAAAEPGSAQYEALAAELQQLAPDVTVATEQLTEILKTILQTASKGQGISQDQVTGQLDPIATKLAGMESELAYLKESYQNKGVFESAAGKAGISEEEALKLEAAAENKRMAKLVDWRKCLKSLEIDLTAEAPTDFDSEFCPMDSEEGLQFLNKLAKDREQPSWIDLVFAKAQEAATAADKYSPAQLSEDMGSVRQQLALYKETLTWLRGDVGNRFNLQDAKDQERAASFRMELDKVERDIQTRLMNDVASANDLAQAQQAQKAALEAVQLELSAVMTETALKLENHLDEEVNGIMKNLKGIKEAQEVQFAQVKERMEEVKQEVIDYMNKEIWEGPLGKLPGRMAKAEQDIIEHIAKDAEEKKAIGVRIDESNEEIKRCFQAVADLSEHVEEVRQELIGRIEIAIKELIERIMEEVQRLEEMLRFEAKKSLEAREKIVADQLQKDKMRDARDKRKWDALETRLKKMDEQREEDLRKTKELLDKMEAEAKKQAEEAKRRAEEQEKARIELEKKMKEQAEAQQKALEEQARKAEEEKERAAAQKAKEDAERAAADAERAAREAAERKKSANLSKDVDKLKEDMELVKKDEVVLHLEIDELREDAKKNKLTEEQKQKIESSHQACTKLVDDMSHLTTRMKKAEFEVHASERKIKSVHDDIKKVSEDTMNMQHHVDSCDKRIDGVVEEAAAECARTAEACEGLDNKIVAVAAQLAGMNAAEHDLKDQVDKLGTDLASVAEDINDKASAAEMNDKYFELEDAINLLSERKVSTNTYESSTGEIKQELLKKTSHPDVIALIEAGIAENEAKKRKAEQMDGCAAGVTQVRCLSCNNVKAEMHAQSSSIVHTGLSPVSSTIPLDSPQRDSALGGLPGSMMSQGQWATNTPQDVRNGQIAPLPRGKMRPPAGSGKNTQYTYSQSQNGIRGLPTVTTDDSAQRPATMENGRPGKTAPPVNARLVQGYDGRQYVADRRPGNQASV